MCKNKIKKAISINELKKKNKEDYDYFIKFVIKVAEKKNKWDRFMLLALINYFILSND